MVFLRLGLPPPPPGAACARTAAGLRGTGGNRSAGSGLCGDVEPPAPLGFTAVCVAVPCDRQSRRAGHRPGGRLGGAHLGVSPGTGSAVGARGSTGGGTRAGDAWPVPRRPQPHLLGVAGEAPPPPPGLLQAGRTAGERGSLL